MTWSLHDLILKIVSACRVRTRTSGNTPYILSHRDFCSICTRIRMYTIWKCSFKQVFYQFHQIDLGLRWDGLSIIETLIELFRTSSFSVCNLHSKFSFSLGLYSYQFARSSKLLFSLVKDLINWFPPVAMATDISI